MEEQKASIGAVNNLGYDEIDRLHKGDKILEARLVRDLKHTLLHKLMDETPNEISFSKAFHIKIELLDGMNLVGKINEIPVQHIVLEPRLEQAEPVDLTGSQLYGSKKLTWAQRFKIFVKGEF